MTDSLTVRFRIKPPQCGPSCRISVRVIAREQSFDDPLGMVDRVQIEHTSPDTPGINGKEIRIDRTLFRSEGDAEAAIQQLIDRELAAWGNELHPPNLQNPPLTVAALDQAMAAIGGPSNWFMQAAMSPPGYSFAPMEASVGFFGGGAPSSGFASAVIEDFKVFSGPSISMTTRRQLMIANNGVVFYMPYPEACEQRRCDLAVRDPQSGVNIEQNASIVHRNDERIRPLLFTRGLLTPDSIARFASFAAAEHARVDEGAIVIEIDEGGPPVRQAVRLREECARHNFGFERYPRSLELYGRFFHNAEGEPPAYFSISLVEARDQVLDAYIDPWLRNQHGTPLVVEPAPKQSKLPAAYHGIALPAGALVRTPGRRPSFLDRITTQKR